MTPKKRFEKELERFLILAEGKINSQFLELVGILEKEEVSEECVLKMAFFKFQEMKLEKIKTLFKAIEERFKSFQQEVEGVEIQQHGLTSVHHLKEGSSQPIQKHVSVWMEHHNVCTNLNEAQLKDIFEVAEERIQAIFVRKMSLCQLRPTGVVKAMGKIIEQNDKYCSQEFDRPFFQQALETILNSIDLNCRKLEEFVSIFNELTSDLRAYEEEGFSFIDANKIKRTIKEIEVWPSTCHIGFFIIDIQKIRRSLLRDEKAVGQFGERAARETGRDFRVHRKDRAGYRVIDQADNRGDH